MKVFTKYSYPLVILLFALSAPAAQSPEMSLPPKAFALLNQRFPDWRYAHIPDEVRQALKLHNPAIGRLDMITGDFDGDARADYAALINHGKAEAVPGAGNTLVIFMERKNSYEVHTIEDSGGEYIALSHKGERAYSYELQKEFRFKHDAISACIFEKAATSYIYERGRFRAIITGD